MFKTYLKLAFRNLWKRKAITIINVSGLAVGLTCCALVFLYFQHELSFDKGFDNYKDIYRITTLSNDGSKGPTTSLPYAKYLTSEIPEIEEVSRLDATNGTCIIQVKDGTALTPFTENSGYWVDPTFFNIFSFHFLYGDRHTAFNAPNTIVLSQSLSQKLFGATYPIGKSLKAGSNIYTVTGVFKEDLLNHIKAGFFASNNSDGIREAIARVTNWVINPNYYTYVKLRHGSDLQRVLTELHAYTRRHAADEMKVSGVYMTNGLQALADIHLQSAEYQSYMEEKQGGNIKYLYLLSSIALAILLLGCINYMNLSTAQALGRAREVGVRRVLGAEKKIIRFQFLVETLAISLIALLLAVGLALLVLPAFNNFTGQQLSFFAPENRSLILYLFLIALLTGLVAGIYPAFYLSSFKPVRVLKGKISDSATTFHIRKVLVVAQFIISTCLVFATLVIWDQLHFMMSTKPGFDQDQQLVINLTSDQAKRNSAYLISQLAANSNFKSVTGADAALASGDMNLFPAGKTVAAKHDVFLNLTDENYLKTLGLKLISGTNFSPLHFTNTGTQQDLEVNDIGRQVILNEEAVKVLGFNPYTAPGKYVSHLHNGVFYNYKIVGVVKNYHYASMHSAVGPCVLMPENPGRFNTIIAKVKGDDLANAIKFASQKWKQVNPDTPFDYSFLNDVFRNDYLQDEREQQMMGAFTFVAIFISCLGLFGLITYSLGQKAKEIGIRKVIGASITNIVMLFYKQYLRLVLIANIIALPLGWYFMNNWLRDFAYRVSINWWIFAASLSAGIIIAFCTIAFKTISAARVNPVNSLRGE